MSSALNGPVSLSVAILSFGATSPRIATWSLDQSCQEAATRIAAAAHAHAVRDAALLAEGTAARALPFPMVTLPAGVTATLVSLPGGSWSVVVRADGPLDRIQCIVPDLAVSATVEACTRIAPPTQSLD